MSKAVEIKISMEVLNSLSPQKGMLNAKAGDLQDNVFVLHSVVAPTGKKSTLDGKSGEDDNLYVKARYVNSSNKKSFLIPIRALLNLEIAKMPEKTKNVKFDAATMETIRVHEHLIETITDNKPTLLPQTFTVVAVENRVQEGTNNIMYPPYCYDRFSEAVKKLRENDAEASLDPIYSDYEFMQSLYADKPSDRFASAEPTKRIVISI